MTEQRREQAIKYIMSSLEDGYLDLGLYDQDELQVIKEAMNHFLLFTKTCKAICDDILSSDSKGDKHE